MASLLFSNRSRSELTLQATEPDREPTVALLAEPEPMPISWPIGVAAAGFVAALVGWVLCAGVSAVAWVAAGPASASGRLADALAAGTNLWLLANGAGAHLGRLEVTLVPWGATALFALLLAWSTGFAARASQPAELGRRASALPGITLLATAGYLAPVAVVSLLLGGPVLNWRGLAVIATLCGAAAWAGSRTPSSRLGERWPGWARRLPRAVVGAQLVLLAAGAGVLVVALVAHLGRVTALTTALQAGVVGNVVLLLIELAFAPNTIVWAASYALGAGFGLGDGSVVAPAATQVGLLPGIPLLGAVPGPGPGVSSQLLWLAAGVVSGVVAAWLALRSRPNGRLDQACLVGSLSAVLSGLVFVVLAWASTGDLGGARLTNLGPRLIDLVVMAVSTLGLAGLAAGLVLGLRRGTDVAGPDRDAG